jgi:hypothetical protein
MTVLVINSWCVCFFGILLYVFWYLIVVKNAFPCWVMLLGYLSILFCVFLIHLSCIAYLFLVNLYESIYMDMSSLIYIANVFSQFAACIFTTFMVFFFVKILLIKLPYQIFLPDVWVLFNKSFFYQLAMFPSRELFQLLYLGLWLLSS